MDRGREGDWGLGMGDGGWRWGWDVYFRNKKRKLKQ